MSHLKNKHSTILKKYEAYKKEKYIPPSKKTKIIDETGSSQSVNENEGTKSPAFNLFRSNKNKRAEELITKFVLESASSFQIVENPAFVKMIS